MGRSQSSNVEKQATGNSAEDQARAGAAFKSTVNSINNYSGNLDKFMKFGRATYGDNGEFMRDQNTIATGAAKAGANKVGADLATNAMRTGANTANYAPAVATAQRDASQDLTQTLASADADRLSKLTAINQYGVQASSLPSQVYSSLYGPSVGGSNTALGVGESAAANSPSMLDFISKNASEALGAAAKGAAG